MGADSALSRGSGLFGDGISLPHQGDRGQGTLHPGVNLVIYDAVKEGFVMNMEGIEGEHRESV